MFAASLSSLKRGTQVWSLPSSTQGKDYRREKMMVVVLLYRTNLPYSVKTCPGCIPADGLAKLLEKLQLLLLTKHRLAPGHALKLENEFRLGVTELLLDLSCHPIEPSGHLFFIST
jgi:hypothetical protein